MDGGGVRRGARGHRDREMGGRVGSREVDGWLGMMFGNLMLPKIIVLKMIWDFVLPYLEILQVHNQNYKRLHGE